MDTHSLEAFLAVAEQGSFTRAADLLYLTQPAISKRIALLEDELGTRLFDRIGRKIQLTPAGKALLPKAKGILLDMEDARRAINQLTDEVSGTLSIGTSHHIGLHRLPPVLKAFSRQFPRVQLDIHFIDSEEAWEGVHSGSLELGIVTLPPEPDNSLVCQSIWPDPLVFLAAPDFPLATRDAIGLADLTRHSAILPSRATFTRRIVETHFAEAGLDLEVAISTNYLETIKMMTAIGLGWSVLPATMADESVQVLPVTDIAIERTLGVVYHPDRSLSNGARQLLEILQQASG